MNKKLAEPAIVSWSLIAILVAGMITIGFVFFTKTKESLAIKEVRSYEEIESVGQNASLALGKLFAEIERSLSQKEDAAQAISSIGIQSVGVNRPNLFDLLPGEVQSLKVGRLARFEGRTDQGNFVKAANLGLKVFPSFGDPPVALNSPKDSSLIVLFPLETKVVIFGLPLTVIRQRLEQANPVFTQEVQTQDAFPEPDQNVKSDKEGKETPARLSWALATVLSSWHSPQKSEDPKFHIVDRSQLHEFQSTAEQQVLDQLAGSLDQVVSVSLEKSNKLQKNVFGVASVPNQNIKVFLQKNAVWTFSNTLKVIFEESTVLLSCLVCFLIVTYFRNRKQDGLLEVSKDWIEALPARRDVPVQLKFPTNRLASVLSACMKKSEQLAMLRMRDHFFTSALLSQTAQLLENTEGSFQTFQAETNAGALTIDLPPDGSFKISSWTYGFPGFTFTLYLLYSSEDHRGIVAGQNFLHSIQEKLGTNPSFESLVAEIQKVPEIWHQLNDLSPNLHFWMIQSLDQVFFGAIWGANRFECRAHVNVVTIHLNGTRVLTISHKKVDIVDSLSIAEICALYVASNADNSSEAETGEEPDDRQFAS